MEGDENIGPIRQHLEELYPGGDVLAEKNMNRRLHCFYVRTSEHDQQVLKISYECMMDNDLHSILRVIDTVCAPAMQENENMEVVLFNDFHIEIRELD